PPARGAALSEPRRPALHADGLRRRRLRTAQPGAARRGGALPGGTGAVSRRHGGERRATTPPLEPGPEEARRARHGPGDELRGAGAGRADERPRPPRPAG